MRAASLAAALLWGCGGEECALVHQVCVEGYHGSQADLAAEIHRCAADIAARGGSIRGATVRYVDNADPACGGKVWGCWLPRYDIALVERANPPLCHELKHRAQFAVDGVIDLNHSDPRWWGER